MNRKACGFTKEFIVRIFLFIFALNYTYASQAYDGISLTTRHHEVSVILLDDFTWVQPQFNGSLFKVNNAPNKIIRGVKIISDRPVINAIETLTGVQLKVNKVKSHYEIYVPDFIYISAVNFSYLTDDPLKEVLTLPSWLYHSRISAFAHITNRELAKNSNEYSDVEKKIKGMGFNHYVRNVKSHDKSKQTLWNSLAIISSNGEITYKDREDFVRGVC